MRDMTGFQCALYDSRKAGRSKNMNESSWFAHRSLPTAPTAPTPRSRPSSCPPTFPACPPLRK
jgi:hypothetical protein